MNSDLDQQVEARTKSRMRSAAANARSGVGIAITASPILTTAPASETMIS